MSDTNTLTTQVLVGAGSNLKMVLRTVLIKMLRSQCIDLIDNMASGAITRDTIARSELRKQILVMTRAVDNGLFGRPRGPQQRRIRVFEIVGQYYGIGAQAVSEFSPGGAPCYTQTSVGRCRYGSNGVHKIGIKI